MRQYVLCLAEAMPPARDERDCPCGGNRSAQAEASQIANTCRCWPKTELWRRHRSRSEQAGTLRYPQEGGLRAFA